MERPATYVSTIAGCRGDDPTFRDGPASQARFYYPLSTCVLPDHTIIVGDRHNHRVRRISMDPLSGEGVEVDTRAGTGEKEVINRPSGVEHDPADDSVVFTDCWNHAVKRISARGEVSLVAGGTKGFADGRGPAAQFKFPMGLCKGFGGDLFVADQHNHAIRRITAGGEVSTFAGHGEEGFADGKGGDARFHWPSGVSFCSQRNVLYVADTQNHAIREVAEDGTVTTYAGGEKGTTDAIGVNAQFDEPRDVAVDLDGRVVVADEGSHLIRLISRDRAVVTLCGTPGVKGYADGDGTQARLAGPSGVSIDQFGSIVFADCWNSLIRRVEVVGIGSWTRTLSSVTVQKANRLEALKSVENVLRVERGDERAHAVAKATKVGLVKGVALLLKDYSSCNETSVTACSILALLSFHEECREQLHESGALMYVADAMRSHIMDASVQRAGCSLLWNVASTHREHLQEVLYASAVLRVLKTNLRDQHAVEKASGALFYLTKSDEHKAEVISNEGAQLLVSALRRYSTHEVIAPNTSATLWNLAMTHEGREALAAANAVKHLCGALAKHTGSAPVRTAQKLCGALHRALQLEANVQEAVQHSIVEHCIRVMALHLSNAVVQQYGTSTLASVLEFQAGKEHVRSCDFSSSLRELVSSISEKHVRCERTLESCTKISSALDSL